MKAKISYRVPRAPTGGFCPEPDSLWIEYQNAYTKKFFHLIDCFSN